VPATSSGYAQLFRRITGSDLLPIDVWVDGQQHVRRIETDISACTAEGRLVTAVSMELFDYGPQPAVRVPPAAQTVDITGQLQANISRVLSQLHC